MLLRTGKRYVRTAHISCGKSISDDVRISAELRAQAIAVEREPNLVDAVRNTISLQCSLDLPADTPGECPGIITRQALPAIDSKRTVARAAKVMPIPGDSGAIVPEPEVGTEGMLFRNPFSLTCCVVTAELASTFPNTSYAIAWKVASPSPGSPTKIGTAHGGEAEQSLGWTRLPL